MNRLSSWLKTEMDVEFFTAVHWVSIAWMYALIRFLFHKEGVGFWVLTEMGIVGYLMSWSQRILTLNEFLYQRIPSQLRRVLWVLLPTGLLMLFTFLFGWFPNKQKGEMWLFLALMFIFLVIIEIMIHYIYKEDTKVLNDLLKDYQKEE